MYKWSEEGREYIKLRRRHMRLLKSLDVTSKLLSELYQEGVINETEMEDIDHESAEKRTRTLLMKVQRKCKSGQRPYERFLRAIEHGDQSFLSEKVRNTFIEPEYWELYADSFLPPSGTSSTVQSSPRVSQAQQTISSESQKQRKEQYNKMQNHFGDQKAYPHEDLPALVENPGYGTFGTQPNPNNSDTNKVGRQSPCQLFRINQPGTQTAIPGCCTWTPSQHGARTTPNRESMGIAFAAFPQQIYESSSTIYSTGFELGNPTLQNTSQCSNHENNRESGITANSRQTVDEMQVTLHRESRDSNMGGNPSKHPTAYRNNQGQHVNGFCLSGGVNICATCRRARATNGQTVKIPF